MNQPDTAPMTSARIASEICHKFNELGFAFAYDEEKGINEEEAVTVWLIELLAARPPERAPQAERELKLADAVIALKDAVKMHVHNYGVVSGSKAKAWEGDFVVREMQAALRIADEALAAAQRPASEPPQAPIDRQLKALEGHGKTFMLTPTVGFYGTDFEWLPFYIENGERYLIPITAEGICWNEHGISRLCSLPPAPEGVEALLTAWKQYCEGLGGTPDGDDYLGTLISQLVEREVAKALATKQLEHLERTRQLRHCLAFFASVIKSGEPWTEVCQTEYDKAGGK